MELLKKHIVDFYSGLTFDEQGNLLTPPTYREGYHYDIMSEIEIDFGANEIFPDNPKHTFAGI